MMVISSTPRLVLKSTTACQIKLLDPRISRYTKIVTICVYLPEHANGPIFSSTSIFLLQQHYNITTLKHKKVKHYKYTKCIICTICTICTVRAICTVCAICSALYAQYAQFAHNARYIIYAQYTLYVQYAQYAHTDCSFG